MDHPIYPGPFLYLIAHWIVSSLALFLTSKVVPGFKLRNFKAALITALAIAVADYSVYWILLFLTLPFVIITFGLFTFVIDAIILKLCSALLRDFEVTSWWSAIFGAFILWVLGRLLHFWIV